MFAFNHTRNVLKNYSNKIHTKLTKVRKAPSYDTYLNNIQMVLRKYPLPIPSENNMSMIPDNILNQFVSHIPLIEDPDLGIRMKMIVWKTNSNIGLHYHNAEDCFFQALYPGMVQTLWDNSEFALITPVKHTEYSYISDIIGPHSITNTNTTNVSFHLYIRETFYVNNDGNCLKLPTTSNANTNTNSNSNSNNNGNVFNHSDPELVWYMHNYEDVHRV